MTGQTQVEGPFDTPPSTSNFDEDCLDDQNPELHINILQNYMGSDVSGTNQSALTMAKGFLEVIQALPDNFTFEDMPNFSEVFELGGHTDDPIELRIRGLFDSLKSPLTTKADALRAAKQLVNILEDLPGTLTSESHLPTPQSESNTGLQHEDRDLSGMFFIFI